MSQNINRLDMTHFSSEDIGSAVNRNKGPFRSIDRIQQILTIGRSKCTKEYHSMLWKWSSVMCKVMS